jgi:hypothetical protein
VGRFRGRARRETFLWENAAAGVVTTATQASRLRSLFPDLTAVSPERLRGGGDGVGGRGIRRAPGDVLRLVQFGSVYEVRLPWPLVSRLRQAAGCKTLLSPTSVHARPELLRHGSGVLNRTIRGLAARPRIAQDFDAALVIGNQDPGQLPSKAVQYLTLPIPRIALTSGPGSDLAAFAAERSGFIAVDIASAKNIALALAHLRRAWSSELTPPPGDSWDAVAREIAEFAIDAWAAGRPPIRDPGVDVSTG